MAGQIRYCQRKGSRPLRMGMFSHHRDPREAVLMSTKTKIIVYLLILALLDTVIPVPIMEILLITVVIQKPPWFRKMVDEIYG